MPIGLAEYDTLDKIALTGDKAAIKKALVAPTDGYVAKSTTEHNDGFQDSVNPAS